jgi:hypothetical protein
MTQPQWDTFGVRLGRAIDRWPGGGQRKFATALRQHAEQRGLSIPTSYRTLVNYLNGTTRPPVAWVDAAADVLRWRSTYLLTGEGEERQGAADSGFTMAVSGSGAPRMSVLMHLIANVYCGNLPMDARLMIVRFAEAYFSEDGGVWNANDMISRREDVLRMLKEFYGPLLAGPSMREFETAALAASLTAAAYIRIGARRG